MPPKSTQKAPKSQVPNDEIMEKWHKFFQFTPDVPDEKKSLYAIGKLTQVAMVQYMKLRGAFAEDTFQKCNYKGYKFFTMNIKKEQGKKINNTLRTAGDFINSASLKAFRFQLFHNPDKPNEIGEELHFMYYYGDQTRVQMSFGGDNNVELDLSDCTFDNFLQCFGEIIGKVRNYCAHLNPLPVCEKRFRTSFYKKPPTEINAEFFNPVSGAVEYASGMRTKDIGYAQLSKVATAALLRTCYSTDEIDNLIAEAANDMVQTEVSNMLSQGEQSSFMEIPRREQRVDDALTYQNTVVDAGSVAPQSDVEPPVQDEVVEEQEVQVSSPAQDEVVEEQEVQMSSPAFDRRSVVSCEAVFSPFARRDLVDEDIPQTEPTNDNSDGGDANKKKKRSQGSQNKKSSGIDGKKGSKTPAKPTRASSRKKAPVESDGESSEEDSYVRKRKQTDKRKMSNREAIAAIMNDSPKRRRR